MVSYSFFLGDCQLPKMLGVTQEEQSLHPTNFLIPQNNRETTLSKVVIRMSTVINADKLGLSPRQDHSATKHVIIQ